MIAPNRPMPGRPSRILAYFRDQYFLIIRDRFNWHPRPSGEVFGAGNQFVQSFGFFLSMAARGRIPAFSAKYKISNSALAYLKFAAVAFRVRTLFHFAFPPFGFRLSAFAAGPPTIRPTPRVERALFHRQKEDDPQIPLHTPLAALRDRGETLIPHSHPA